MWVVSSAVGKLLITISSERYRKYCSDYMYVTAAGMKIDIIQHRVSLVIKQSRNVCLYPKCRTFSECTPPLWSSPSWSKCSPPGGDRGWGMRTRKRQQEGSKPAKRTWLQMFFIIKLDLFHALTLIYQSSLGFSVLTKDPYTKNLFHHKWCLTCMFFNTTQIGPLKTLLCVILWVHK